MSSSQPNWDTLTDREMEALALRLFSAQEKRATKTTQASRFERYQNNILGFVTEVLGDRPWEKQRQILLSVQQNAYTAVRSCHGAGKTYTAARAALWFLQCFPGAVVITTAPSTRQVKELLWRQIRGAFENSKVDLLGRLMTTQIDIAPEWYATGFATDEPINFQGPHSPKGVLFIGDEASGLAEWVFDTARGFMTQDNAKMLLIGNPNYAHGSFHEAFQTKRYKKIHISAFDVPKEILRADWKREMLEDFGSDSPVYQIRVMGNFPSQGTDALFDMAWIETAFGRHFPSVEGEMIEIGVDVARYGDAESVLYVRSGPQVIDFKAWRGKDTMKSAAIVAESCRQYWPKRIKVDEIGVGSAVVDRLRELKWPVEGVNSNGSPRHPGEFYNLRAEQYANLAALFAKGQIGIPRDKKLMRQLLGLTYEHTAKGNRKVIGKEELRKAGRESPDRADALMLCFAGVACGHRAYSLAVGRESGVPKVAVKQMDRTGLPVVIARGYPSRKV